MRKDDSFPASDVPYSSSCRGNLIICHLFGSEHLSVLAHPRRQDLHRNRPGLHPRQRPPGPSRTLHPRHCLIFLYVKSVIFCFYNGACLFQPSELHVVSGSFFFLSHFDSVGSFFTAIFKPCTSMETAQSQRGGGRRQIISPPLLCGNVTYSFK